MKEQAKKHVLVAVMGKTPQIITETLYALMIKSNPRAPISEIHIITTAEGAQIAWRALGGPEGAVARLCREYGIDPEAVRFEKEQIKIIERENEESLDDVRTSRDNAFLESQMFGFIKRLTEDPNTVLHCSIAGGRKTMSAYMMLALTLYGREQDRLTHVLVPEEFETNSKFFFPPKRNEPIAVRKGADWIVGQTRDAHIELADIRFLRLRSLMGKGFGKLQADVEKLVRIAQDTIEAMSKQPDKLIIDLSGREARFGDKPIGLSGIRLALLAYYADTKANHCSEPDRPVCGDCHACFQEFIDIDIARFMKIYPSVIAQSRSGFEDKYGKTFEEQVEKLEEEGALSYDNLQSYKSKINKALKIASPDLKINVSST